MRDSYKGKKNDNDSLSIRNVPKYILSYFQDKEDLLLIDQKAIIEVQGEQHLKYIKYFHSTVEAFEYQKYKDVIKKNYAISLGYSH